MLICILGVRDTIVNETHRTHDPLQDLVFQWGRQMFIKEPHGYIQANYDVSDRYTFHDFAQITILGSVQFKITFQPCYLPRDLSLGDLDVDSPLFLSGE